MTFKTIAKMYLTTFHILGFSSYQPNGNRNKYQLFKCARYIQAFVCIFLGLSALVSMNSVDNSSHQRVAETIIINIILICDVGRATLILLENIFYSDALDGIMNAFEHLELYFAKHLQHHISFRRFAKEYRINVIVCMGFAIFYSLNYCVRCWAGQYCQYASYVTKWCQFVTAISYLHMIFYVKALSYYLCQLNAVIARDAIDNERNSMDQQLHGNRIRNKLKCIKVIHFRLCTISRRISHYFGYSTIALCMHAFTDPIYALFWLYLMIKSGSPLYNIWSKPIDYICIFY